jgi:cyanophycin synthetase
MAANAAAWSLGLHREKIKYSVESFVADIDTVPGRFNLLKLNGATVVVDYGHNVSSLEAIIEAIENFTYSHCTIVYSTAGDRRDCDIIFQGILLGEGFDSVILYEGHYMRGREKGDIIRLFRKGLNGTARAKEVMEIYGSIPAIDEGLRFARPDELVVIQADVVDETIAHLRNYLTKNAPPPKQHTI